MAKRPSTKTIPISGAELVPEQIDHSILVIRGHKVLLDSQLAAFYGVETKRLVEAVKRNIARFPEDFMLQLSQEEWDILRSQFATSISAPRLRSQFATLKAGRGQHRKYLPYAFTEQGVAMLSSVLRSPRAVEINIQIMRAFVRLRQLLSVHKELAERLAKLEAQMVKRDQAVDQQFREVFALLEKLFSPPPPTRNPIGFHVPAKPAKKRS
jgi:ORF6N domain